MARILENGNCGNEKGKWGESMDVGSGKSPSGGGGIGHKWGGEKLGGHHALLFSDSCRVGSFAFLNSKFSYHGFACSCS